MAGRCPGHPRLVREVDAKTWMPGLVQAKPGHDGLHHAIRCAPASIRRISPVMLLDCAVARKHTTLATSSAVEARLSGTLAMTVSRTLAAASAPRPLVNHGVSI